MKKYFINCIVASFIAVSLLGCSSSSKDGDFMQGASFGQERDIPLAESYDIEDFSEAAAADPVFQDVMFGYNSYRLSERNRNILAAISEWLKDNRRAELLIEGHCDNRGSNAYNIALGEKRALSVRRYLINLGIDASRIHTISYGEEKPLAYGDNESAWSANRRAHFLISK